MNAGPEGPAYSFRLPASRFPHPRTADRFPHTAILSAMSTPADERPMGRTYALVIFCHVAVIATLWWIGHIFSR